MPHVPYIIVIILAFLIGAWAVTKYPKVNVIGELTGM